MPHKNFQATKAILPWRIHYFYLDRQPWIADKIFADEKIPVHFKKSFSKPDSDWEIITCWVNIKYAPAFERCMERLRRDSLLKGRTDYDDVAGELAFVFDRNNAKDPLPE